MSNPIRFRVVFKTHPGLQRTNNEDNFILNPDLSNPAWTLSNSGDLMPLGNLGGIFVVADGMGGANAGEVASGIAVQTFQQQFSNLPPGPMSEALIRQWLTGSILEANSAIVAHGRQNPETAGMGTTLVAAWLFGQVLYYAWVGDSRLYAYRPGHGLIRLSKDHSYVQELVNAGKLSEEEAFYHPDSNIITQSLGDGGRPPKPDFAKFIVGQGDRFVLCSDGLNSMLTDPEIAQILGNSTDIGDCRDQLIAAANEAGGADNTTVIVFDIVEGPAAPAVAAPEPVKQPLFGGGVSQTVDPFGKAIPTHAAAPFWKKPAVLAGAGLLALLLIAGLAWMSTQNQVPKANTVGSVQVLDDTTNSNASGSNGKSKTDKPLPPVSGKPAETSAGEKAAEPVQAEQPVQPDFAPRKNGQPNSPGDLAPLPAKQTPPKEAPKENTEEGKTKLMLPKQDHELPDQMFHVISGAKYSKKKDAEDEINQIVARYSNRKKDLSIIKKDCKFRVSIKSHGNQPDAKALAKQIENDDKKAKGYKVKPVVFHYVEDCNQ